MVGEETCDDNITNWGCNDNSIGFKIGWECNVLGSLNFTQPTICEEICGDGLLVGNETCDDGKTGPLSGCLSTCRG